MKTLVRIPVITLLIAGCTTSFLSCKKKDAEPGLSAKIQQIVPADLLSTMKAQGMPINEGTKPPNIEGIFVSSPHTLAATYAGDFDKVGAKYADFIVMFSGQNPTDGSVSIDIKNGGSVSTGLGGFISGSGNKFSLFVETDLRDGTATAKQIRVFSGEVTSAGIKDFYSTVLLKEKKDPNNRLIDVGKMRIVKDGDGLASKRSTFRIEAGVQEMVPAGKSDSAN